MDDIKRAVRDMYDESGEYFSKTREKKYGGKSSNWPITQKYLDKLRPGQSVLDVGCGSGRLLSGLPTDVGYLGIDFSKTLIEIVRENYPEREFHLGDMVNKKVWEKLGKYDAVFCVASLHHIPNRMEQLMVLGEIKKVLKPGGFMFLSVWNLWGKKLRESKLKGVELVTSEIVEIPFRNQTGRHVMAIDEGYLRELVEEVRWKVEKIYVDENNLVVIGR